MILVPPLAPTFEEGVYVQGRFPRDAGAAIWPPNLLAMAQAVTFAPGVPFPDASPVFDVREYRRIVLYGWNIGPGGVSDIVWRGFPFVPSSGADWTSAPFGSTGVGFGPMRTVRVALPLDVADRYMQIGCVTPGGALVSFALYSKRLGSPGMEDRR